MPELWLYSSNDRIFPPDLARRLYDAFKAGTTAPVRFVTLPPYERTATPRSTTRRCGPTR